MKIVIKFEPSSYNCENFRWEDLPRWEAVGGERWWRKKKVEEVVVRWRRGREVEWWRRRQ